MKKTWKIILALALVFSLLLPGTAAYAAGGKKVDIADRKTAVVRVFSEYESGSCATGSAFGVGKAGKEPEYFVTNSHVCLDEDGKLAENIYILLDSRAVHIRYDSDGRGGIDDVDYSKMVACKVVNADSIKEFPDVAILHAEKPIAGRDTIALHRSSADLKAAATVYALGFPAANDNLNITAANGVYLDADADAVNLTQGVVSKTTNSATLHGTDVILHSATISSGNSGGPLIDENGAVVGINTYSFDATAGQFVSIYIDYAVKMLEENKIDFTDADAGPGAPLKTLILCCVMAAVVIAAAVLISTFRKRAKAWVDPKTARELRLQGVAGHFAGRRFPLTGQVTVGRAPDNNIVFPTETPGVSAHHCVFLVNGSQVYVKDLNSTNGTAVNGSQRITPDQLISVKVGDRIALGSEQQSFMITYKDGKLQAP